MTRGSICARGPRLYAGSGLATSWSLVRTRIRARRELAPSIDSSLTLGTSGATGSRWRPDTTAPALDSSLTLRTATRLGGTSRLTTYTSGGPRLRETSGSATRATNWPSVGPSRISNATAATRPWSTRSPSSCSRGRAGAAYGGLWSKLHQGRPARGSL